MACEPDLGHVAPEPGTEGDGEWGEDKCRCLGGPLLAKVGPPPALTPTAES